MSSDNYVSVMQQAAADVDGTQAGTLRDSLNKVCNEWHSLFAEFAEELSAFKQLEDLSI